MLVPKTHLRCDPRQLAQVIVALLVWLLLPMSINAEGFVHLLYFYDPNCGACEEVHHEVLEPLLAEYGDRVIVEERNIAEKENFELLLSLEEQYKVVAGSIPEVFIGQTVLVGPYEIGESLIERIEYYLEEGGVELPTIPPAVVSALVTPSAECDECGPLHEAERRARATRQAISKPSAQDTPIPAIHAAFFYQPGCDECDRSEHDLQYVQGKYLQLVIHRFDVKDQTVLNQYLCNRAGVPNDEHLTAPALFVGDGYLTGDRIRGPAIEALIGPYLSSGVAEAWTGWETAQETSEEAILERFRSFGLLTVVGAGLLDGVNPCAFATMIFLISYLSVRKRKGAELLATGAAFTSGVFLTYLGVGVGLLRFLSSLSFLAIIGKWVYGVTLLLCLALAWGSFFDYRKAKEGRLSDMSLKLPDRLRGWIRTLIREGTSARRYVLSSFLIGFAVSIVELACTGQVYLPTIIFVLGVPEWRAQASAALVLYNVMFILPLIGVFLLVYFGTTSQQLIDWMTRRAAGVKLGTSVLFLLLAGWLGYSVVTS